MNRTTLVLNGIMLALVFGLGAAPLWGAASSVSTKSSNLQSRNRINKRKPVGNVPAAVSFRTDKRRGLLVQGWLNGQGPYTIAIDTGAGLAIISESTAQRLQLKFNSGRPFVLGGVSGNEITAQRATLDTLALGEIENRLPRSIEVAVAQTLPSGVDMVLDPTDAYSPFGYSIDFPAHLIAAFDPQNNGLNLSHIPVGGTVVSWLREGQDRRPYVRLGDGRLALIDTGSSFGFAISAGATEGRRMGRAATRDLGGGSFRSERVSPTTISIGSLVLNRVPTDILSGTDEEAPVLLGRDALNPFVISFDPLRHLIEIAPPVQDKYRSP